MDPATVVIGVVGKPFGLHGEVYVRPDPDLDVDFAPGTVLEGSGVGSLTIAESRLHRGRRIVRFERSADRSSAERLRGTVLSVPRSHVGLEEGAWWVTDLLGADVVDERGGILGVVEQVLDGTAHDFLVLARPDGGEILVPAVEEFVEIAEGQVVLRPIPGLLDPEREAEGPGGVAEDPGGAAEDPGGAAEDPGGAAEEPAAADDAPGQAGA